MKALHASMLSGLALAAMAAGALVYDRYEEQNFHKEVKRFQAVARRLEKQRVAICEKRKNVALEPSGTPPLSMDGDEWRRDTFFKPPVPVHSDLLPLANRDPVGEFVVEALIDEAGCVWPVKVLQSPNRGLDAATLATVEKWAYMPATRNHRPVRVIAPLKIRFPLAEPGVLKDRLID